LTPTQPAKARKVGDSGVRVAAAPAPTIHEKATVFEREQAFGIEQGIRNTAAKEKTAIKKRLLAMYFMVKTYMAFNTFEGLMDLIHDVGGLKDCPQGKEAASYDNASNNLKSRATGVEMVEALAHAVRSFVLPKIQESPRISLIADETGDNAHRNQLGTVYKCVLLDSFETVMPCAGLDDLARGTADVIWKAIVWRAKMDKIELKVPTCPPTHPPTHLPTRPPASLPVYLPPAC